MQSLFLLSSCGEVLIERHFRGTTSRSVCDYFWERASGCSGDMGGGGGAMGDAILPPVLEVPAESGNSEHRGGGGGGGGTLYLFHIGRDDLTFLAVCPAEVSPLLVIEFLHRVADIFVDYFGSPADESAIKDNFSTVYQLLEEMVDYGWPLTTEPNALKAMIRPPTVMGKIQQAMTGGSGSSAVVSDALPSGTVSNMPWRRAGVKYSQNEIYVDIVEEVDAIVDVNGNVISSDVQGSIQAQSNLSGVPDLLLTFKEPEIIDDCSFHPCVRYGRYDTDRVVSFVPPDGAFQLMRYSVRNRASQNFLPPIHVTPQLSYGHYYGADASHTNNHNTSSGATSSGSSVPAGAAPDKGRIVLSITARPLSSLIFSSSSGRPRGSLTIEDVSVTIPFLKIVRTANLTVNVGHVTYDEVARVAKWTIGKLDGGKQALRPQLTGTMVLETNTKTNHSGERQRTLSSTASAADRQNPPITVTWKIPLASVSGLTVSGLSLSGEAYKPYKGVRNITKSGRFQIRCY